MAERETMSVGRVMETSLPTSSSGRCVTVLPDASVAKRRARWGETDRQLLVRFNPDVQRYCISNVDRCFEADVPTLREVGEIYSSATMESWLDIQLSDLVSFCGVKGKGEFMQVVEPLICVIVDNFGYLKLSELMLFFQQFKAGVYGRFYGQIDPLVISVSLRQFLAFRASRLSVIARRRDRELELQRAAERRRHEEHGEYITADEWNELRWLYNQ